MKSSLLDPLEEQWNNLRMSKDKVKNMYNTLLWSVVIGIIVTFTLCLLQYGLWGEIVGILTLILLVCTIVANQRRKVLEEQLKNHPGQISM